MKINTLYVTKASSFALDCQSCGEEEIKPKKQEDKSVHWGVTDKQNHKINVLGLRGDFLILLDQGLDRQISQPKRNLKKPLEILN